MGVPTQQNEQSKMRNPQVRAATVSLRTLKSFPEQVKGF